MSEPITQELRGAMGTDYAFCDMGGRAIARDLTITQAEFDRLCDAIDAVHANLERENASLKAELDRVLGELDSRGDSMHDGGSITDELRTGGIYRFPSDKRVFTEEWLTAIADRIDAAHESACAEAYGDGAMSVPIALDESAWVELPKDADGVPWHVGDRTESGQTIQAMGLNKHGWYFVGTVNDIDPRIHRHHHAPTVEDVLQKLLEQAVGYSDAHTTVALDAIVEFSAKLRLAGDAE